MNTVFWIATDKYIQEAVQSAASLKRHMPDLKRVLCTPAKNIRRPIFDEILQLETRTNKFWYLDSVGYFNEVLHGLKAERLLYLDTDTYVCDDLSDLFILLDRFDFVGTHAPGRCTTNTVEPIPPAFPEVNLGVNAFRNVPIVEALFRGWQARFEANPTVFRNNDQGALREALWNWTGKFYILPPEYNMRWGFGGFARYKVKVLHGRGNYEAVEKKVNSRIEMRGWDRGAI